MITRIRVNFLRTTVGSITFGTKVVRIYFLLLLLNFYWVIIDVWRGKREERRDVCSWMGRTGKVNSVERPKNMSPAAARCSPRVGLLLLQNSYSAVLNGLKKAWSANKLSKNNNNDDKIKIKNLDVILLQKYYNVGSLSIKK